MYLDPPLIELGFYWHEHSAISMMRRLLMFLVDRDCRLQSRVVAIKSSPIGCVPPFAQLAYNDLDDRSIKTFNDWKLQDIISSTDWLPVEIDLTVEMNSPMGLKLSLAGMLDDAVNKNPNRVVEIAIGGADCNLVQVLGTDAVDPETAKRAARCRKWCDEVFQCACIRLQPDYAAASEEWSLQPPEALNRMNDLVVAGDCYIADTLCERSDLLERCTLYTNLFASPMGEGTLISRRGETDDAMLELSAKLVQQIKSRLLQ